MVLIIALFIILAVSFIIMIACLISGDDLAHECDLNCRDCFWECTPKQREWIKTRYKKEKEVNEEETEE